MRRIVAAFLFLLVSIHMSWAGDGVSVTTITGGYGQSGRQVLNGLKVDLAPGWHAYWKSPGETGLPPDITISGSNTRESKAYWPLPERFVSAGFESVGYTRSFVVPIVSEVADTSVQTDISIKGALYACSDICVPVPVDLSMTVRPGATDASGLTELAQWLARAPGAGRSSLSLISSDTGEGGDIVVRFATTGMMTRPAAYLDMGMQAFGVLKSIDAAPDGTATARFGITNLRDLPPDFSSARIVLSDGSTQPIEVPLSLSRSGFAGILALALAGGLILNAMPCVFPVLAIKILMLVSLERSRVRPSLAAMAAGVVTTFLLIGAVLSSMKAAGMAVGWGIQFQQPLFLSMMALLLVAFGASMTGAFSIILPSSVATRLTGATDGDGVWKSYLQGVVLTLLATPCSAPFVGTAVAYGLSSGVCEIIFMFVAMGCGMALPFAVLAAFPRLIAFLPRPGRWMEQVKHATAAAMFATAGWLIYLLHAAGSMLLLALVTLVSAVAIFGAASLSRRVATVMLVAILAVPATFYAPGLTIKDSGVEWRQLDARLLKDLVSQGRTVFVDVTADWCLTCKVNDRGTLSETAVVELLQRDTIPMKGDWTRPDEKISEFLRSHGRYGIPFYLVIGPGAPDGIVLPELLTHEEVVSAVRRASAVPALNERFMSAK